MVRHYQILDRKLVEVPEGPCEITIYVNPDEAERRYLLNDLKLDEHTFHSAMDPDELSRVEFEPEHVALIFKRPKNYSVQDQFLFKVGSTGAFLFKDRLIVVLAEDAPVFDGIQYNRQFSPAGLVLKLIFRSIVHFREHLKIISKISDELQDKINTALENRHLINLFTLQKSLVYYLNSINSNGALIEKLKINATRIGFTAEEVEMIDDTLIENSQCLKQADIYSNILASLMDARASIVSNNLNVLMKTLNIITIGIMVPTFVVSAFSMNVDIPFQHHPLAFALIMGLAVASVASFLLFWRYKKW
ncbi:divalent metal ion transporter [candidate division GN15 bacterium]|uniref:Divalent metal ion transporter n=1 Tax=candidate division GN15 bacterium TaxID=2072418 RepID=A0A855X2R9_9BACT|nr:MAG: divalent metal ion transporter [candidate division GN15 bacterium]